MSHFSNTAPPSNRTTTTASNTTDDDDDSLTNPGPEPITSATARMNGLEDVVNLIFSDRFGGGTGLYSGELDEWGRPHGQGTMTYDSGKKFKGSWSNGGPNAAEYQQQMNPPPPMVAQQQQYPQPYPGAAATYVGGGNASVAQPTMMHHHGAAVGAAASPPAMYGNPMFGGGGYNYNMQNGGMMPTMNYQGGGPVMGQGMQQGMRPHPGMMNRMNSQASMMGPGMAPMASGIYATAPGQPMPPPGGNPRIVQG